LARPVTALPYGRTVERQKCAAFFDRGHFVFYIPLATKHVPSKRALDRLDAWQASDLKPRKTSMRQHVIAFSRCCFGLSLATIVVAAAATVHAQTFVKPTLPSSLPQAAEQITFNASGPDETVKTATISHVLESGRTLELGGHWADALTKYEEALHEFPEDQKLQAKFDVARLHYSLEQRYDDRSFREALRTMRPQQSLELYNDLLSKIDAHYYTNPPWQDIAQRGAAALDIALAEENFFAESIDPRSRSAA